MNDSQSLLPEFVINYIGNEAIVFCLQSNKSVPSWLYFLVNFKYCISVGFLSFFSYFVLYNSFNAILNVALQFDLNSLLEISIDEYLYALFFLLCSIKILDLLSKIYKSITGKSNLGPIYVGTDSRLVIYNNDKKSIWSIDWTRFTGEIKVVPYKNDSLIVVSTDEGTSLKFNRFRSKNIKTPKEIIIFGVDPVYQIDLQIKKLIK